jgi:transcription-repair coupling factor (superfamily II helicase)
MSAALDPVILAAPALAAAADDLAAGRTTGALGLSRAAWPFALAALHRASGRPLLVVAPGDEEARELASELRALAGDAAVSLWPTRGVPSGGAVGPAPHLVGLRARARGRLGEPGSLVVASVAALVERAPADPPEPLELRRGGVVAGDLVDALTALGYERVPQVEERGEMAVRGGIVDVFPTTAEQPVRVDLFGDDIEGLRSFSPFTQVTVRQIDAIRVWPASEPVGGPLVDTFDDLAGATLVRLAPGQHRGALSQALELVEDEAAAGALADPQRLLEALQAHAALDLAPPAGGADGVVDAREARFAARGHVEAAAEIARLAGGGLRVLVAFSRRGDLERAARPLERANPKAIDLGETVPAPGQVSLAVLPIRRGFISADLGVAIIPEGEILRRRRASARAPMGRRLRSFLELRVGDYVVHEDHGVGRLVAFETQTVANVTRDYLALAFAGEDRVWVPQDQLEKVTRYIGADGSAPPLSKLGGKAWERLKARVRAAVHEMAGELFALYEGRGRVEGFAFPENDAAMHEFEQRFPYRETPDQERAIDEVMGDMERPRPMDRLICGDVGFGKTEVAMRAAYKAAIAGKQVMVLVPTTLLAQQHLGTFRERFADTAVEIEMVSRLRSAAESREVLGRFRSGAVDILIGTHRLLGMDVQPRDLGLVILDEEQRFGVAQKESLRQLRLRVDVLSLSATPIPRTLQMSMSGMRDISVIETPPSGRRAIATHVGEFDQGLVREALERERSRGGQSFWLHNRVETIEDAAAAVRALVPDQRVLVAHGQMGEQELEDVMTTFLRGEADVLVSTTIIEAGLDIPNANTLVVERADMMGLAQLYQLRGRVGRSQVAAHAYLMYPSDADLTRDAAARLRAVADYTELGSGLRIAMRDLEIRGAGNLLGDEQSGHVEAIGFELYLQMLNDAIAARRGEIVPEQEARVEIPVSAYIPAEYVGFEAAKIDLHRRIATADADGLTRLADELGDRFGPPPPPVEALIAVQRLRLKLMQVGANRLSVRSGRVTLAPVGLTSAALRALRGESPRALYSSGERTVSIPAPSGPAERIQAAEDVLDALIGAVAQAA